MADTLPGLMLRNARHMPGRPAMREKALGIWQTHGWQDFAAQVRLFALGLQDLGFAAGEKLAVIGDNRPRLYWAELAAMALGGVAVPLDQDGSDDDLAAILTHAEAVAIVAEDQEQVDRVLSIRDRLPMLRLLVHDRSRGMRGYDAEILHAFEAVQERGRARDDEAAFDQAVERLQPGDAAMIFYTPRGTGRGTGRGAGRGAGGGASGAATEPKGVVLSHAGLVGAATAFSQAEDLRPGDNYLSCLPMAWMVEAVQVAAAGLVTGAACNCPESPESVNVDRRELGPSGFIAPPQVWEAMAADLLARAQKASGLKRATFECFRALGARRESLRAAGSPIPFGLHLGCALGEFLVFAPVRDQLGLRRARWCYSAGGPLSGEAFLLLRGLGINLKRLYGPPELAGVCTLQADGEASPDHVGRPCPGVEVKIDADGQVLARGPGRFLGYHRDEARTQAAVDADGWVRTGDTGTLDGAGRLALPGQAKSGTGKSSTGKTGGPLPGGASAEPRASGGAAAVEAS